MPSQPHVLISINRAAEIVDRLRRQVPEAKITVGPYIEARDQTMPPDLMRGVDVLLTEQIPANFDDCPQLRWIQLSSAGYAQVFNLPIIERGIRVTNGKGIFDVPIAEWNIMMMLTWQRNLTTMLENQRQHRYQALPAFQQRLQGSIVGLYGYGGLARETARLTKAMGLTVWAYTRDGVVRPRDLTYCADGTGDPKGVLPDRAFGPDQLQDFCAGVDYFIIAVPITNTTTDLIGEELLRMLKPSAVLLNPARARIVQEEALIRCLREQWIRGAAIDDQYAHPLPPDHPLWSMPNVILTPHIAGDDADIQFVERALDIMTQNLRRYIADQPLLNELTEQQILGH